VRDTLTEGLRGVEYPIEPLPVDAGYFLMADVEKMRGIIPKKYLETHDYEDDPNTMIVKNKNYMKDGSIPLDLAVCRWLAMEKKVISMPNSFFYHSKSPYVTDRYIRLAICKGMETTKKSIERI